MSTKQQPVATIGVLWRGDPRAVELPTPENNRLHRVFAALAQLGVEAIPIAFSDDAVERARDQLLRLDGVLVWVDPIMRGQDRTKLDALLREVAAKGVWVSAHPDVILKMGTKEVIYATRDLGWGTDTRIYRSFPEFCAEFPKSLSGGPRVLKQYRGNGGIGVWRVEFATSPAAVPQRQSLVRVLHALRGSVEEEMPLGDLVERCEEYFAGDGRIIDQAFQPRLAEGMIRCYMAQNEVAGFGHQFVTALLLEPGAAEPPPAPPRFYYGPDKPEFQALKRKLESAWIPEMQAICGVETDSLPAIWDADFLLGPKTAAGEDTYVLCEINISAVFPIPDEAFDKLAAAALRSVLRNKESRAAIN